MRYKYTVYPDQSGHVFSGLGSFPIYIQDCDPRIANEELTKYRAEYHWHNDLEFLYLGIGSFDIVVNGTRLHINEGQCLFINSGRMHRLFFNEEDCKYITVRIDPQIFTRNYELGTEYFNKKFGSTNIDYLLLDPSIDWQAEIIDELLELRRKSDTINIRPLSSISTALSLLEILGSHIPDSTQSSVNKNDYDSFTAMTQYIREHVADKIQIEDIAHAGHVSRAKVYSLFYSFSSQSPNTYLMTYRIEKSANMLRGTNLSIADISGMCGFRTPSYFASVFRKEKGLTPREYRAKYN